MSGETERPHTEHQGAPSLIYQDEAGAQRAFLLDLDRDVTIGRGDAADVRLWWDPSVSLVHAEAMPLGPHWLLSDDGLSRNGTFVNGERITGRRRLRDGDAVRVGRTTLYFNDAPGHLRDATTITDPTSSSATVTLLFTDLVGSTELMSRLGEEVSERLRRDYFAILRGSAREHGGHEVKSLGDGLMLAFASTLSAVSCAVDMQRRVAEHVHEHGEEAAGLRIGLNSGEVISAEDDYFGAPVVVAKRLCDRAVPGQIVASEVVLSLVGARGGHQFVPLGKMQLKGFPEPTPAFAIAWQASATESGARRG